MRKPLIAANWKMFKTPVQADEFLAAFLPLVSGHNRDEIVLAPPTISLAHMIYGLKKSNVYAAAQNMHWLDEGPYTGETSPTMLTHIGCSHVILGHSERRQYFNETDETVNLKLKAAFAHGIVPIVCVGEHLSERENNLTTEVLKRQVAGALKNVFAAEADTLVIAYEPVWAIGTGKTATPEIAADAHKIIRKELAHVLGKEVAENTRILYGGSVKPDNCNILMSSPEIDGALVGGASLDPVSFAKICTYNN